MASKPVFKSRKTPSSIHPPAPPRIPLNIDVLFYSVDEAALARLASDFADKIVTSQILYEPGILAMARVVFEGTRWEIYHEREVVRVVPFPAYSQMADWDQNGIDRWDNTRVRSDAQGVAFYQVDSSYEFSEARFEQLQDEFKQHLVSVEKLELDYNPHLKIHRKLDEEEELFHARCLEKLREKYSQEYQNLLDTLERQENRLKEKLEREVREHGNPEDGPAAEMSGGLDLNRQEMDAQGAIVNMDDIRRELETIRKQRELKFQEFEENLQTLSRQRETDILRVNHGDIKVLRFALVWLPHTEFIIQENETRRTVILRSF